MHKQHQHSTVINFHRRLICGTAILSEWTDTSNSANTADTPIRRIDADSQYAGIYFFYNFNNK